jgi:hypothetical protein
MITSVDLAEWLVQQGIRVRARTHAPGLCVVADEHVVGVGAFQILHVRGAFTAPRTTTANLGRQAPGIRICPAHAGACELIVPKGRGSGFVRVGSSGLFRGAHRVRTGQWRQQAGRVAGTRRSPAAAVALAVSATGGLILTVILAVVGHVDADPAYTRSV